MSLKKPDPFGYISFGKDGHVTPHISRFSRHNDEREKDRGEVFANWLTTDRNSLVTFTPLKQDGHDGLLTIDGQQIVVQITEIQELEYTREGSSFAPGGMTILTPEGHFREVDHAAADGIFIKKIEAKKAKCYSKPADGLFWLLIYTPFDSVVPVAYEGGALAESNGWQAARRYCAREGIHPFDEVWFLPPTTRPKRLWPAA